MTNDNFRWLGTTAIAGLLGLLALYFTGALALAGRTVPDALALVDAASVAAFFTSLGTMIGAKSSQNAAEQASNAAANATAAVRNGNGT